MTAIGITGQMGSGKTYLVQSLLAYLEQKKIPARAVSVDQVRRHLMTSSPKHLSLREEISAQFGVPLDMGAFDLQKLAAAVFADASGPATFWRLAGADILSAVREEMRGPGLFLLEWSRLVEDGFLPMVDSVIATHCTEKVQQERLAGGDLPPAQIEKRLSLQMTLDDLMTALGKSGKSFVIFDTTQSPLAPAYHHLCDEVLNEAA